MTGSQFILNSTNLSSRWKLDEGTGTSAADSAGSHTGTLVNGPTWGTGMMGGAVQFDGSNDYIDCGTLVIGSGDFSFTAWVKAASYSGNMVVATQGTAVGGGYQTLLFLASSGKFQWTVDGSTTFAVANSAPTTGIWYHLAGTYEAAATPKVKLYINGVLQTTTANIAAAFVGNKTFIGLSVATGSTADWAGLIDDVRIYSRAITASEALSMFNLLQ